MSIETNKAIVRDFFNAVQECDWTRVRELMPEDGVWWVPEGTKATTVTREPFIAQAVAFQNEAAEPFRWEIHQMVGEGDRVCAEASSRMPLKNGKVYANKYLILLTLKNGQIVHGKEYMNTQHVNDIYGDPD